MNRFYALILGGRALLLAALPYRQQQQQRHKVDNIKRRYPWRSRGTVETAAIFLLLALLAVIFELRMLVSLQTSYGGDYDIATSFKYQQLQASEASTFPCQLDATVLEYLAGKGLLDPKHSETPAIPLRQRYTESWSGKDTCWLANQILLTEALGGYHPHCNIHAQNRNLLYSLSTIAGSMRPASEAVKLVGSKLKKYHFDERVVSRSYQMQDFVLDKDTETRQKRVLGEKERVVKELEGPGISVLPRQMDQEWLDQLTDELSHSDFKSVSEGWSVKGLNAAEVVENGWHGSFSLYDLNEVMAILQKIAYDPFILDVLQETLGAPPVIRAVDVYMGVPKKDGTTRFSFDTWHKDFNSARSIKGELIYVSSVWFVAAIQYVIDTIQCTLLHQYSCT